MRGDPVYLGLPPGTARQEIAFYEKVGFRFGQKGTHTSRTIMLDELFILLRTAGSMAQRNDYRSLIVGDNCLGKRTVATRKLSDQRLSELYSLDPATPLFRTMRQLWQVDEAGRPLLSLLLAIARDPLLRMTAPSIFQLHPGEELSRQVLLNDLHQGVGDRFNPTVLEKIVRNIASSWTQSGHLNGRNRKVRCVVKPSPAVVTYALLLGYALGARGAVLFQTLWTKILDVGKEELISLATDAKRFGFLDIKASGGIVEVSIDRLLTEEERRLIHGAN